MRNRDFKLALLITLTAALPTLSGCGYYSNTGKLSAGTGNWVVPGTGTNTPTTTPATDDDEEEDTSTGVPAYNFTVRATGYNSTYVDVRANKVLKVRFTPGQQDRTVAGTGFNAKYSLLWVYIKVGASTQPTPALYNGVNGGDAVSSGVMDYSTAFTRTCSASSPACRQTVRVYIQQPNNDYYCLNYGMYCPGAHVYDTHPWNGTIQIQTDDTDPV
jgi:hypothetical protein